MVNLDNLLKSGRLVQGKALWKKLYSGFPEACFSWPSFYQISTFKAKRQGKTRGRENWGKTGDTTMCATCHS